MTCLFCNGDMLPDTTTDFTELDNCMVIIKNVPCLKCDQCGETVYTGRTLQEVEQIIDKLKNSLTEVAITNYPNKVA